MSDSSTDLSATLQAALGPQYRLERELGRGGMGVVYLAQDVALERPVAVKVISPELALNRTLADRFIAEARLIARLRHPNIVAVYTAGTADGLLYYVMDHIPGESLRALLQREGRLAPEMAARLAADVAAALDAAGRAGVVHRDIKPENILIEETSTGPRAMLADFGIAHAMWGEGSRTGPGIAMGTPAYMSPEQASGDEVDARSDIYSLGVVAYEMLAGHPPFQGPRRAVISQQIVDPPPPLDPQRPDASLHLIAAIERSLEKVPEARWQTGDAFRRALVGTGGLPPVRRRRPRRVALALAGVAVAAAVFLWGTLRREGPPRGANPRHALLILPFTNLRDDQTIGWLSPGSVSMLDLALSQWRELKVVGHERVHDIVQGIPQGALIGLDDARRFARAAGVWTVVLGEYERTRDSLHLVARAYDVATGERLEQAETWGHLGDDVRPLFDELAAKLLDLSGAPAAGRAPLASVTSSSLEAYRAYLRGLEALNLWNLVDAEEFFREAVTVDSSFGLAFFRLAQTRGWMSSAADPLTQRYLAEATRHAGRLPPRERQMIAAYRALVEGESQRAETLYGQLVEQDSADADAWYGLGDAWFHDLRATDRADAMTRSLQAFRRALGLDPHYGLAYDHVHAMLTQAATPSPYFALQSSDRFVRTRDPAGGTMLSSEALEAAVTRARREAVSTARAWTEYQPQTLRAHRALLEAHLTGGDPQSALAEVARIRELSAEGAQPLAGFLEARVRLRMGEAAAAARVLREALTNLDPVVLRLNDLGQEVVADVLSGANVFAFLGDLEGAEAVIRIADQLRRVVLPPGAIVDAYGDDRVWQHGRLSALYSAVGGPPYELRELWQRVSRVARGATARERSVLAWAGASAAQGLLVGTAADPSALAELQSLTGVPPRPEFRALAAIARGDSAAARAALAEGEGGTGQEKPITPEVKRESEVNQAAAFAMGDPRPVAAEVHFQLGDYTETLTLLEPFQPDRLGTRSFDARWGLLARVRLLRGLAYERLGRVTEADREYREVIAQWEGADQRLLPVVEEARAGRARVRGMKG
jgi:eukaryotic-like serine/threonine-protein kinase